MATIARNRALDEVRRARPVAIDDRPEVLHIADPAELQSDRIEASEDLSRMFYCLDRLEPDRRDIVRLAYIEGLSREALAKRYGRPVATIKTWLHRSLKQLKDCLGS
jgi:RNA polymerase sigma-70 factor (ECF subfamily)